MSESFTPVSMLGCLITGTWGVWLLERRTAEVLEWHLLNLSISHLSTRQFSRFSQLWSLQSTMDVQCTLYLLLKIHYSLLSFT